MGYSADVVRCSADELECYGNVVENALEEVLAVLFHIVVILFSFSLNL